MKRSSKTIFKKAVIDQMLLWIVLFISFVTIFLLVIDYYMVLKTKDRTDTIVNYGVRMKALGRDDIDIVSGINNIKSDFFDTVITDDLSCTDDNETTSYQVIFSTSVTFNNMFLSDTDQINSKASAFNEVNSHNIDCNLTLRTN